MLEKINFTGIVKDHVKTLKRYSDNRYNPDDLIIFIVFPLMISIAMITYKPILIGAVANLLITCGSVFAALLLNLLLIIYDIVKRTERQCEIEIQNANTGSNRKKPTEKKRLRFLHEIYINISFSILLCVIILSLTLVLFFDLDLPLFKEVLSFLIYFLSSMFIFTFVMVLKRVHVLLSQDFTSGM